MEKIVTLDILDRVFYPAYGGGVGTKRVTKVTKVTRMIALNSLFNSANRITLNIQPKSGEVIKNRQSAENFYINKASATPWFPMGASCLQGIKVLEYIYSYHV